jgi:hypothetical protein
MNRFPLILAAVSAACSFAAYSAGEYHGRETAPLDSELATAQELTGDVGVRWIGYSCGDDGATIVTRDMPGTDCRESRRLSESVAFDAPDPLRG